MGVPGRRRQAQEEVAEAARRRLELLGRELERAGLRRLDPDRCDPGDPGELEHSAAGVLGQPRDLGASFDPHLDLMSDPDLEPGPVPRPENGLEPGLGLGRGVAGGVGTDEDEQIGLVIPRGEDTPATLPGTPAVPAARPVLPAGRHLRPARAGLRSRFGGWLADQVPDTFRGRVGLGPGPVLLVVALVAVALVLTAFVVLRSGDPGQAVPARTGATTAPLVPAAATAPTAAATTPSGASSPGATGAGGPSGTAAPSAAGVTAGGGTVTVDVAGAVRRPGVATLPAGSRVVDALERAGGVRGRVDLTSLNLARVLVDGEQVLVGRGAGASSATGGVAASGVAASGASAAPGDGALVNLNTATLDQLDTLPGVGPVTAQKILDWRTAHGAFSSVDELLEVDGIGEKTLADLAPHATL